ncbi:MAG: carboxypeptidase regulatory-like domain-containing protein, partial [Acidobacteriota bacterium]
KDGSALPGVSVVLTGVGAPQTFISDGDGDFRFVNLSPGSYAVKADLSGFGSATRTGIQVGMGSNVDIKMTLAPTAAESITVTAEAPLLDVRKTGTGADLSRVELESIPTSRDPWTVLQQAPAVQVDRMNVGGNQSGQQSVYIGKGAAAKDNTWNVDGVNITDTGAAGSSPTYYDFDAFEEMQITTGGSDPRIQTPGVQLNMVTKRGTNDFKGSGRYFYTPGSYQASSSVPSEATAYLVQTNAINYVRDLGIEVGGPIWRDRIWFWGARADQKISNEGSLPVGAIPAFDNIILRNKNAKLNAQIIPSNSAVGLFFFGDKVRNARSIGPTRPFETSWRQSGPTKNYKFEDTQIFGPSLYLTGLYSRTSPSGFGLIPNGGIGSSVTPAYRDLTNVWHNTYLFYSTDRPQKQYRADGSKFFDMGSMNHELKFGFGYRTTPVSSQSGWPGATQGWVRDRTAGFCAGLTSPVPGAQCIQARLFRDAAKSYDAKFNDIYAGDTILMGDFTLQVGLRYDSQKSKNTASSAAANPILATPLTTPVLGSFPTAYLPAISFNGDSRELKWNSVTPRVGLTYALGSDKKTLLRAGYNRYVSSMTSTASLGSPFTYYSYFTFAGFDLNGDHKAQRNELLKITGFGYVDPSAPAAIAGTTRLDYSMKPPKTDELLLGVEHELMSNFSVGATYTYRRYSDLLMARYEKTQGKGDYYTSADFVICNAACQADNGVAGGTITDPRGNKETFPVVPYYVVRSGVAAPLYAVVTNRPDYKQTFNGLELTATKRLANNWMMRANVSYNDRKESSGSGSYQDPTPRLGAGIDTGCIGNCNGQVIEQSRGSGDFGNAFLNSKWTFNVTGLYQLPWQVSLGASVSGRQGYVRLARAEVTTDAVPLGTEEVILNQIGSLRFPNVLEMDFRVAKDFRFYNKLGLTISADLFNAPNKRTILQRQTLLANEGDAAGDANNIREIQSPRAWRFGARFNF